MIVEDQTILREGLEAILNLEEDIQVVATAKNGLEAYDLVSHHLPRIVLMDIEMPVMNGHESLKKIKAEYPEVRLIMFTTFPNDDYLVEALIHGASGYLLKDIPHKKLVQAIRDCDQGDMMLPTSLAAKLAAHLRNQQFSEGSEGSEGRPSISFTEREKDIAKLMLAGQTNREIAQTLFLTEGTTKNYISTLYSKLGTNDRGKAIVYLSHFGLE
nr:response regulator transcription factor [Caldalkalibacillus salinus]